MVQLVSILTVVLVVTIAVLIVAAARGAAIRADLASFAIARRASFAVFGWLGFTALVAASGVLQDFDARPPRLLFVIGGSVVFFTLVGRAPIVRRLLAAAPLWWPVAIHTMRIPIELGLWGLFLGGVIPEQMTFEGRNFDVLVGVAAPVVAFCVARGLVGRRAILVFNVVSLGLLVNIVSIALTSMPGPFMLDWPGPKPTIVASWPFVWLPAFLVPVALFGHVLSLRQLLSRGPKRRDALPCTPVHDPAQRETASG